MWEYIAHSHGHRQRRSPHNSPRCTHVCIHTTFCHTRTKTLAVYCHSCLQPPTDFRPGQIWLDTDGLPIQVVRCGTTCAHLTYQRIGGLQVVNVPHLIIQAHGGSILYHQGIYYWYGEFKDGPTVVEKTTGYVCTPCVVVVGYNYLVCTPSSCTPNPSGLQGWMQWVSAVIHQQIC